MATLNGLYSFTPSTAAKASEVNTNFNTVKAFVDAITTGDNIDGLAITEPKINNGAVSEVKIANNAVTANKLATNAVTTDKIIAAAVTEPKIAIGAGSIKVYATTAARDAAITAPTAGIVVYINSDDASEGLWHYNGSTWYKGAGWNTPWGVVARTTNTANSSVVSTNTFIDLSSLTFTAIAGRLYKVQFSGRTVASDIDFNSDFLVAITDGSNNAIQTVAFPFGFATGGNVRTEGFILVSPAAGSVTYKVRMGRTAGTGTVQALASGTDITHFYIEDIGAA
jgi:hypothetical protein